MKIRTLSAFAAASGVMILNCETHGAYTGLSVHAHTTIVAGGVARQVYRVYANFTQGSDLVNSWSGPSSDPVIIQALGSDFFNPGGGAANSAPTLEQIFGGATPNGSPIPPVPSVQWGTFATIGVPIADFGSGPTEASENVDQTILSPGFPTFIPGNSFSASVVVFAVPQAGPNFQGRADYAPDGDPLLRVMLMQLTVNLGAHVQGELDLTVQNLQTFEDQSFSSVPAPGALALLGLAGLVGSRRRRA